MKIVVVLPDGAADDGVAELRGLTPLAAANIPHMDRVARTGRLGRVVTVPDGFTPATDVATLSIFGYDPHTCYTGRAPIEAAARQLEVRPDELIFRCNFVTIRDGRMKDFTAGHIPQDEANRLIADLNTRFAPEPYHFHAGVSYRNLMLAGQATGMQLASAPPHDIPDQPVIDHLPRGRGQERVRDVMARAREMLRDHAVNRARARRGVAPVTDIWLWGQGPPTRLTPFAQRFGLRGAVICGVDVIRGLAVLMGMDLIHVPGATGYIDTDYAAKGRAAVAALQAYDLVVVHVEAADEAGHLANAAEKVRALEQIDTHVVGPLLEALEAHGVGRILIAPDHPTPVATTAHDATPPPFCFAGTGITAVERRSFTEADARAGGWLVDPGHTLMSQFLDRP